MKIEQLITVLVRFFALYMLLTIVFHYGMAIAAIFMQNQTIGVDGNGVMIATFAILLLAIALLWRFATDIARWIIPATSCDELATTVSAPRLETLLFSVVGLWLVVTALPEITRYGVYIASVDAASRRTEIGLYGHLVQSAVGIWLLVGSQGIVNALRKLRGSES